MAEKKCKRIQQLIQRATLWFGPQLLFGAAIRTQGGLSWWSYCKGLALQDGASPWVCHFNALEFYCRYPTIVDVPISIDISQIPSTVVIEELESDESYDGSSASSASASRSVEVPSTIVIVEEEENDEESLSYDSYEWCD